MFETVFGKGPEAEGNYAFVTHVFADASRGAVGLFRVGHPATMAAGH